MNHPESDLQIACVRWFDLQYPKHKHLLFAIPNGGRRSAREGARLKQEGVRAGVWDLFLAQPRFKTSVQRAGLFIEMKAGKGKLTEAQKAFRDSLNDVYAFEVCYTLEEFMQAITDYLK